MVHHPLTATYVDPECLFPGTYTYGSASKASSLSKKYMLLPECHFPARAYGSETVGTSYELVISFEIISYLLCYSFIAQCYNLHEIL
jgi:hypothetical protein